MTIQLSGDGALFSPCNLYRFLLWRVWDDTRNPLVFLMLNPSLADGVAEDNTLRRCIGYAKYMAYGGVVLVNLYPFVTPYPWKMKAHLHPPDVFQTNDHHIMLAVENRNVMCAWGANADKQRAHEVLSKIEMFCRPFALKINADGSPAHPLYLPKDIKPVDYSSEMIKWN